MSKICKECGQSSPDGNNFCMNCGAALEKSEAATGSTSTPVDVKPKQDVQKPVEPQQNVYGGTHSQNSGYQPPRNAYQNEEKNGLGTASLVLGIISLVANFLSFSVVLSGLCTPIAFICGVVGIILGVSGKSKGGNIGSAKAGFVCSVIGLVLSVLGFISCIACTSCLSLASLS